MNTVDTTRLRELLAKATKNWSVQHEYNVASPRPGCKDPISCFNASSSHDPDWSEINAANAQLAAAAVNALPSLLDELEALRAENARLEGSEEQLCGERDDAEQAMSQAYYLVTGESPQWSNHFGYVEAHEEISDRLYMLKSALADAELGLVSLRSENAALREALEAEVAEHEDQSQAWGGEEGDPDNSKYHARWAKRSRTALTKKETTK